MPMSRSERRRQRLGIRYLRPARNDAQHASGYLVEQNIGAAGPSPFRSESWESRMARRRRATPSTRSSVIRCTPARTPLNPSSSILGVRIREKRGSGARRHGTQRIALALIPDRLSGLHHDGTLRAEPTTLGGKPCPVPILRRSPREGSSLALGGLIFCGRCGRRMSIHYTGQYGNFALTTVGDAQTSS